MTINAEIGLNDVILFFHINFLCMGNEEEEYTELELLL